jgi:hypothetical protein
MGVQPGLEPAPDGGLHLHFDTLPLEDKEELGGTMLTREEFLVDFHNKMPWQGTYRKRIPCDHPYFQRTRELCEKWDLPHENRWKNFNRCLAGHRGLPIILLPPPTWTQTLPFDEMVEHTDAYRRLRDELDKVGLRLEHLSILPVFPLFPEARLRHMGREKRQQALTEAFEHVLDFIRTFEVDAIVSLQYTTTNATNEDDLFYIDHPDARKLGSSISAATAHQVKKQIIGGRDINIIQGFHPTAIARWQPDPHEELLRELLHGIYDPCSARIETIVAAEYSQAEDEFQTNASGACWGSLDRYLRRSEMFWNLPRRPPGLGMDEVLEYPDLQLLKSLLDKIPPKLRRCEDLW